MNTSCENARALIPAYLDGEVDEGRAAPLRKHLLDCPPCRELAKSETSLKRWFDATAAVDAAGPVPVGFASRIARRAFAGDVGLATPAARSIRGSGEAATSLKQFVLTLTAAAAVVLILLSIAVQHRTLPGTRDVGADESLDRLYERIEQEDRENGRRPVKALPSASAESPAEQPSGDWKESVPR